MSYLCEVNLSGTKVKTPELPKETKITCLKHIILADGRRFEGEEWSKIRDEIESKRSDEATSSSEEIREEVQQNKVPASDSTEKRDQEVMKIHESKDLQGEAKFVSFVDIDSTKLKSFFNETKSVKFCSLRMCMDIKDLFVEVDEESLGTLETLSISNFPLLETICWGGNFKNLKKLSIDCFVEGVELSSSLKLQVKNCPKLQETDWVMVEPPEISPQE
ncbi:unnamed protein product [Brassica rapa subsp. narinosa]